MDGAVESSDTLRMISREHYIWQNSVVMYAESESRERMRRNQVKSGTQMITPVSMEKNPGKAENR